jgi:hypothetical protein
MHTRLSLAAVLTLLLAAGPSLAGDKNGKKERDVFDYAAQKAAKGVKKIVFVADTAPHGGRGNHEFLAAAVYLAKTINATYPDAYAVVYTVHTGKPETLLNWPKDLKGVDAVVVLLNHGGSAVNPAIKEAVKDGAGFMAVHYGVEVDKGEQGNSYLHWIGGYFETFWSVNPFWTPDFKEIPKHETTRGVKPFSVNDEWYYHMRFVAGMNGVTPILVGLPPLKTIQDGGKKSTPRGGNPDVWKEVSEGKKQVMAWAYERPDGGRGFGFTGLHRHENLGNDNMRTLLLNAVAWVAKLPVPEGGVPSRALDRGDLERLIDEARLAVKRRGL